MTIASYIDHTLLKPDATEAQITKLCEEAKTHHFKSVCINAVYIPMAKNHLQNSSVKICTVVGFPLGMSPTEVKLKETEWAISKGAQEIDMVICIGMVKNQNAEYVKNDIQTLAQFCRSKNVLLKVILETCLLTDAEKKWSCQMALDAGAHFVKTSTGFSTGGATLHDIKLMKEVVKDKCEIKASGGIKNLKMAMEMIEAGATRLGTSSGVSLVQGSEMDSKSY